MDRSIFITPKPTTGIFSGIPSLAIIRWEIIGDKAILGKRHKNLEVTIDNSRSLLEQLCPHVGWDFNNCELKESTFSANEYYPRIYRPVYSDDDKHNMRISSGYSYPPNSEINGHESLAQLSSLTDSLKEIFSVVSPELNNLSTYGHKIRNLLVIACTEVESQWKGILRENNYQGQRLTTHDYIKLLPDLRLNEYKVKLPMYQKLALFSPFDNWNLTSPTQTLDWYHAYNAVKHDRESNFDQAQLKHIINAVIACAILFKAQYGNSNYWKDQIGSFYNFTEVPKWEDYQGYTLTGYNNNNWRRINYPF